MTSVLSWQDSISFFPASFHIPKPNLPVTTGNSWGHKELETTEQLNSTEYYLFVLTIYYLRLFLPGKSHGRRSLVGYSPWGHKQWDTTE